MYDKFLVYLCENVDYEDGRNVVIQFLKDKKEVDGIFVIIDMVVIGVIVVFNEKGIKVLDDIFIMGFSNWFLF